MTRFSSTALSSGKSTARRFSGRSSPASTKGRERAAARLFGLDVYVISPEGSILSKLEWSRRGGSDRQLRDASAVLAANRETLDFDYLRQQARGLGVDDLLELLLG